MRTLLRSWISTSVLLATFIPAYAQFYQITDIGIAGAITHVRGLNNLGQVAAYSAAGPGRTVLWRNGVQTVLNPNGAESYSPSGINDAGQIVGWGGAANTAFLWTPDVPNGASGSFRDLGVFGDDRFSSARAINAKDVIAGQNPFTTDGTGTQYAHPRVWRNEVWSALPLGDGDNEGVAYAINSTGTVAGWSDLYESGTASASCDSGEPTSYHYEGSSHYHAVTWDASGKITVLPPLPGDNSAMATGINDYGRVVGWSGILERQAPTPCQTLPLGYTIIRQAPCVWVNGVPYALGGSGGGGAASINASGSIVGSGDGIPSLWTPVGTDGTTYTRTDLSAHIASSAWPHMAPAYINNSGWIAGEGQHVVRSPGGASTIWRAFVLVPSGNAYGALAIAGGLLKPESIADIDVEKGPSAGRIDIADAVRWARRAAGLDP